MVGIAEIAVAGEDVRAAEVVVVVVGAVGAVEVAAVVTAVGTGATAGTAAEGIKPRIAIYKSQNPHPVAKNATRVGTRRCGAATWSRLFSFGKNLLK
jgi:hypothetical protein